MRLHTVEEMAIFKTMKQFVLLLGLFLSPVLAQAQLRDLSKLQPAADYENLYVQPIAQDSLCSSVMIWIKEGVKAHYHAEHSEQVYILSGTAEMSLGEEQFVVKAGDYVFIPMGVIHAVAVTSAEPLQVLSMQAPHFDGSDRVWVEDIDK